MSFADIKARVAYDDSSTFVTGSAHAQAVADRAELVELVEKLAKTTNGSIKALENIAAYLVKHAASLPPCSLTGIELQIARNLAALAKVQS